MVCAPLPTMRDEANDRDDDADESNGGNEGDRHAVVVVDVAVGGP